MTDTPAQHLVAAGPTGPSVPSAGTDDHARLIAWLADHDELCPRCRYNLRRLTTPRCPECDAAIALTVKTPDLILIWFLLGVIGLSMAMGFDAVVLTMLAVASVFFQGPRGGPPATLFMWFGFGTAIMASAVTSWYRSRVRIQRMPGQWQCALVGLVWLATFLAHLGVVGWYSNWW